MPFARSVSRLVSPALKASPLSRATRTFSSSSSAQAKVLMVLYEVRRIFTTPSLLLINPLPSKLTLPLLLGQGTR